MSAVVFPQPVPPVMPTMCIFRTSASQTASSGTAAERRMRYGVCERSTSVDSRPMPQGPPSMTAAICPLKYASTSSAVFGLGAVVFADAAALDDLNAITHRYVRAEVRARLRAWARQGGTVAAIDAIALIESGLAELCTVTIGVTAPREVRIERLIAREGVTRDYAEARIDAQKPNEWFAQHCNYVLDNGGTLADFQRRCHQLIQEVLS